MSSYEREQEIRTTLETFLGSARKIYELDESVEQVAQILCDKDGYVNQETINFVRLLIKAYDLYRANPVNPNPINLIKTDTDYEN